jgi:predicted porin
MYADGGGDSSIQKNAYGVNVGGSYRGLSIDAVYTKENGAVSASSLSAAQVTALPTGSSINDTLNGTITDNEAWSVMGKYTFDLGGSFKDDGPAAKLTFYGGYQHADLSDSQTTVANGSTTLGGYFLVNVTNTPYARGSDRILQTEWAGVKYETGPWSLTGAYYHLSQDFFKTSTVTASCSSNAHSNCSGDTNTASFLVDYAFTKHFDVYAGVAWSDIGGGLSNSYLATDNTTVATGLRIKF